MVEVPDRKCTNLAFTVYILCTDIFQEVIGMCEQQEATQKLHPKDCHILPRGKLMVHILQEKKIEEEIEEFFRLGLLSPVSALVGVINQGIMNSRCSIYDVTFIFVIYS